MAKQQRLIVLDQNVMRDPDALSPALGRCCRENLRVLIPDAAGFEFSKGSNPFYTWHQSLAYLSDYPELVAVSRKLTKMMDEEKDSELPCNTIVDEDLTLSMRQLLGDLGRGDKSSLQRIVDNWPPTPACWNGGEQHKQWIVGLRDALGSVMTGDALRRLRRLPHEELARWLSSDEGIRFVFQGIKARGVSERGSAVLSMVPSVTAAFVSSFAAIGLYWLAFGGLENTAPGRSTNDLLDIEYAILGSLSVALLTNDTRLSTIHRALATSSVGRQEWFRNWFRSKPAYSSA